MKKYLFWLLLFIAGVMYIGITTKSASAGLLSSDAQMNQPLASLHVLQSPVLTETPSQVSSETQNARVLPPVGSNAGLVIGASVLVLIIIGGVLGSRRREKH